MGYYTDFRLSILTTDDGIDTHSIYDEVSELSEYTWDFDGVVLVLNAKWYDKENHMIVLSHRHKNTTFMLSGIGEDDGDIWREYYDNGKMYHEKAKIRFLPFDTNKLV